MFFGQLLLVLMVMGLLVGCVGSSLSDTVKQVQERTVELCRYLPETNSVAAILTAGNASVIGVGAVAQAICTAVTEWQHNLDANALVSPCPRVNGICVQGEFQPPKGN